MRAATEPDVPIVLAFIRELAEDEKLANEVVATEESLRKSLFGARRAAEVIIAEWQGEPAGFAVYFESFSTFQGLPSLYLEDLFVLPDLRGRGIGRALLVQLARIAKTRNCGRFEWNVLNWNRRAIELYEKLGATPMTEWTKYRLTGAALDALANETI
jgi:GNAT superfamily N-acetyltransferase